MRFAAAVEHVENVADPDLETILAADKAARDFVTENYS